MQTKHPVFITGGTGYIGKRLIKILLNEGFEVSALVRQQSVNKLPPGCIPVIADPFDHNSYVQSIGANSIFIHLLGVSHPGPKKAAQFYSIDLASAKQSVEAAKKAAVYHFVYVSVSQYPTKIMAAYQDARAQGESAITASGLKTTLIRPWYVVGPGHYWPLLFLPVMKIMENIPSTAAKAKSLGLVTLKQMLMTLKKLVTDPLPGNINIVEISDIKKANQ
jgi:uncharacterized protein YbjT (DUF2867 family)